MRGQREQFIRYGAEIGMTREMMGQNMRNLGLVELSLDRASLAAKGATAGVVEKNLAIYNRQQAIFDALNGISSTGEKTEVKRLGRDLVSEFLFPRSVPDQESLTSPLIDLDADLLKSMPQSTVVVRFYKSRTDFVQAMATVTPDSLTGELTLAVAAGLAPGSNDVYIPASLDRADPQRFDVEDMHITLSAPNQIAAGGRHKKGEAMPLSNASHFVGIGGYFIEGTDLHTMYGSESIQDNAHLPDTLEEKSGQTLQLASPKNVDDVNNGRFAYEAPTTILTLSQLTQLPKTHRLLAEIRVTSDLLDVNEYNKPMSKRRSTSPLLLLRDDADGALDDVNGAVISALAQRKGAKFAFTEQITTLKEGEFMV
jgi:hypothetical protein